MDYSFSIEFGPLEYFVRQTWDTQKYYLKSGHIQISIEPIVNKQNAIPIIDLIGHKIHQLPVQDKYTLYDYEPGIIDLDLKTGIIPNSVCHNTANILVRHINTNNNKFMLFTLCDSANNVIVDEHGDAWTFIVGGKFYDVKVGFENNIVTWSF